MTYRDTHWIPGGDGRFGPKAFRSRQKRDSYFRVLPLFLLACFLPIAQASGQNAEDQTDTSRVLRIHKYDLLNGLKTFVVQQQGVSEVAVSLLIKSGFVADSPGKSGMANLVGQMLLMSNQRKSNEQWRDELQSLDVNFKITLEPEATIFEALVPRKNLEAYITLLNTLILYPHFKPERLEQVKLTLLKDLQGNHEISEQAEPHFRELIFGHHPYSRDFRGDSQSLKAIHAEDLAEFYRSHYIPNNSAIIVVGDVAPADIMPFIREKWGGWTKGARPELFLPKVAVRDNYSLLVIQRKDANPAYLIYGHVAPPRVTTDYFSLRVLNMLLGGLGPGSRLAAEFERRHVNSQKLQSLFLFYEAGGEFRVWASVSNESVGQALLAISDTIETLKEKPVNEAELKAAQSALVNSFAEDLKVPTHVAVHVVNMELYDLASDYLVAFPKRVEQITVERIQEAARAYLDPSRAVAVIVGDTDKLPRDLDKIAPVRIIAGNEKSEEK